MSLCSHAPRSQPFGTSLVSFPPVCIVVSKGTKVAMYAQWRSVEDYDAMRRNAAASPFLQKALAIATFDPGMYEIVDTFTAVEQRA